MFKTRKTYEQITHSVSQMIIDLGELIASNASRQEALVEKLKTIVQEKAALEHESYMAYQTKRNLEELLVHSDGA